MSITNCIYRFKINFASKQTFLVILQKVAGGTCHQSQELNEFSNKTCISSELLEVFCVDPSVWTRQTGTDVKENFGI